MLSCRLLENGAGLCERPAGDVAYAELAVQTHLDKLGRRIPYQPNAASTANDNLAESRRSHVRYNRFRPTMLPLPACLPTRWTALHLRW